jgi:prophage antirepressor-like protein
LGIISSNDTAKSTALALQAVGVRAWIQEELGWKKPLYHVDSDYLYNAQNLGSEDILNEFGFYQALSSSNKPKAKSFQKWVYEKVLHVVQMWSTISA